MATTFSQALWREGFEQRHGFCYDTKKPRTRYNLNHVEIMQIRELRMAGNTLSYIAKKFDRCIETIRKHCIDIDVNFVDFDKKCGKGGNWTNHPSQPDHIWRKLPI